MTATPGPRRSESEEEGGRGPRPEVAPTVGAAGRRGRRPRLLLVEDEPETRAAGAYFEALGYRVDTAASAAEALARAEADAPDMVIADVRLDGTRTGIDVARYLRRRSPALPIVVLTGLPLDEVERLAEGVKPLRILSKPLHLLELHDLIQRMLAAS